MGDVIDFESFKSSQKKSCTSPPAENPERTCMDPHYSYKDYDMVCIVPVERIIKTKGEQVWWDVVLYNSEKADNGETLLSNFTIIAECEYLAGAQALARFSQQIMGVRPYPEPSQELIASEELERAIIGYFSG